MKKFFLLLACAVLTILPPAAAQRRPFRPCPQRPHVNELREKTRSKMIASRARTKAGAPTPRYGLIILAAFKNQAFTKDKAYFENLINGSASTSALSYFNEQWNGFYDFHFDITDIVTVSQDYSYYGKEVHNEDAAPEQMIMEACQLVDDKVDFSKYDNDGDGEVDNVFVFYAGDCGQGHDSRVWPHQWYIRDGAGQTLRLDGKLINNYACTSEIEYGIYATIGTFCHEYTHTFGIPDLYDSDYEDNGYAEGIWAEIDLMDAGNQNNDGKTPPYYSCLERWYFEMSEAKTLKEGEYTLPPVHKNGDYYLVPTDQEGEIFLIECRSNEKWDRFIGGSGLMIYHVDNTPASLDKYWLENALNAYAAHQCMDVVECDSAAPLAWRKDASDEEMYWSIVDTYAPKVFWPDGGQTAFHAGSNPAWTFWSGAPCPIALTNIRKNSDGSVSFTVTGSGAAAAPAVTIQDRLVLQDAAIIRWKAEGYEGKCVLRYKESDAASWTVKTVEAFQSGRYGCTLEGLKARTSYDVEIWAGAEGIPGPVNKTAGFTTKRSARGGEYPYIYLKDVPRNEDGSFPAGGVEIPLRLYNAPAGSVSWYLDGKEIHCDADGYFRITASGELRAVSGDLMVHKHLYVK